MSETIASMLKENTGTHMLDSGFGNGRHWQRNQQRDFEKEPRATVSFKYDYLDLTFNVYHWLKEYLDFDAKEQRRYDAFVAAREEEGQRTSYMEDMLDYVAHLREEYGHEVRSPFGGRLDVVNTYNHESFLSQVLQYVHVKVDDEDLILLQVHNGADVRGGYTAPRCFRLDRNHEYLDDTRGAVCCDNDECNASWAIEPGGSYNNNSEECRDICKAVIAKDVATYDAAIASGEHVIRVDEDGNGTCPECHKGTLKGDFY